MHLLFLGLGGRRGGCEQSSPGRQTHHSLCTGSLHPTPTHSQMSCYIAEEEERRGLELGAWYTLMRFRLIKNGVAHAYDVYTV